MVFVVDCPVRSRVSPQRITVVCWALASSLASWGCTLQNEVNDVDSDQVPSNIYRDRSSDRSIELWNSPGENLLAALAEVERNDKTSVRPPDNRILGQMLAESGAYFSAITAYQ